MKFTGIVNRFQENSLFWYNYIPIPDGVFQEMLQLSPDKRLVCTLNNAHTFCCAMMPKTTFHYILLNKAIFEKLKLSQNDEILVEIVPDKSKYGIAISEEMQEVLNSDFDGNTWFEKLTAGKQRSIIYLISKTKNPQSRIEKSFVLMEHLKRNKGQFDFKIFNEDCKNFKSKNTL
jgi:hypothetical protein